MNRNSLESPAVVATLARLFAAAEAGDPAAVVRARAAAAARGAPMSDSDPDVAAALGDAFISVAPAVGRLLYLLARAKSRPLIVEFGTSLAISTIHLAAAARDAGGRVITAEQEPRKIERARAHLVEAGVADVVELRAGDALQMLADLPAPIDFLFLDGWKRLYLPLLRVVEPRLAPGALVVADDTLRFADDLRPFLAHVRGEGNGYVAIEMPMDDGLELAIRTG
jgi:predicted O-methyltransferase YrrM